MPTAEFLSRLQFAWVMSFHILFPAFTIGTAALDGSFCPRLGLLSNQLNRILDACKAA